MLLIRMPLLTLVDAPVVPSVVTQSPLFRKGRLADIKEQESVPAKRIHYRAKGIGFILTGSSPFSFTKADPFPDEDILMLLASVI